VLSRDVVASLQDPAIRTAFASIVAVAVEDLAARDMLARFIAARAATMAVIVNLALEHGEVPPGTDAAEVIQIVTARSTTGCSPPESRSARTWPTVPRRSAPPAPACSPRSCPGYLAAIPVGNRDPAELRYTLTAHRDLGFQGQAGMAAGADKSG
jgi:hypothetical protein